MSVTRGETGGRIVCDSCGEQAASPDITVEQLRRAAGYTRVDGRDYCSACRPAAGA